MKSEFFDRRLLINATYYYYDWKNIQVRGFGPDGTGGVSVITGNFASAIARGIELEAIGQITDDLQLSGTLGTVAGHYGAGTATLGVAQNERLPRPRYTASVAADYRLHLDSLGALVFRPEYLLQGDNQIIAGSPYGLQRAYGLFNARITYAPDDGPWDLSLWGKNLNRAKAMVQQFDFSGTPPVFTREIVVNDPLMWGVELTAHL